MSWIAEYDTQGREFPTCVHVTKTTGTVTRGATYIPIEYDRALRVENAKLRELVKAFDWCTENFDIRDKCDQCPLKQNDALEPECEVLMRELGIKEG